MDTKGQTIKLSTEKIAGAHASTIETLGMIASPTNKTAEYHRAKLAELVHTETESQSSSFGSQLIQLMAEGAYPSLTTRLVNNIHTGDRVTKTFIHFNINECEV